MTQDAQAQELKREQVRTKARLRIGLNTFSSLAYRDYRYLWISMLFSSSGQWIQQVTLSWLVYDLTNSPLMLGLVNGLRSIPFLVSGPFAGVAADRMDRRKLMMSTQAVLMVTSFGMGALILTGIVQVWHIFAFTLVTGIAWSFNQPVRHAMVPSLVPSEALMNAISLNSAAFNMTRVIGPTVAGVLIGLIGTGGNFVIQGFAYLGVMAMIYLMRVPPHSGTAKDFSVANNLLEGLRYVWRNEMVLTLMIMALIPQVLAMPYTTLMPIFAKDVLNIGPEGLGLLMSAIGVGALAGTLGLASLGNFRQKGAMLVGAAMALGVSLTLFGSSRWLPLSLLVLMMVGGTMMAYLTTNNTILQTIIPDELRGRVMSIYMLDQGLQPLGSLMAGAMAGLEGAPFTIEIMGALVFVLGLTVLVRAPHVRRLET